MASSREIPQGTKEVALTPLWNQGCAAPAAFCRLAKDACVLPQTVITVSNSAQLRQAYFAAKGGEVILLENAGETYELLTNSPYDYKNRPLSDTVVIRSADPDDPAVFHKLVLKGANNLEFRDLVFGDQQGAPHQVVEMRRGIENVKIADCEFRGWAEERWVNSATSGGAAIMVMEAKNFVFENNIIENFGLGLDVMKTEGMVVEDNVFRYIQSDGLRMAQIDGGRVSGNVMSDWLGVNTNVAHADFIQLWSTYTDAPTRNLTVEGNLLLANTEFNPQAIFLHNEWSLPYENIAVRDNLIYDSHWNAIWVKGAAGVDVSGNVLVRAPHAAGSDGEAPRVRIFDSTDVTVTDNAASMFEVRGSWTGANNTLLNHTDVRAATFSDTELAKLKAVWGDHPFFAKFLEAVAMADPDESWQAPREGEPAALAGVLTLAAADYDEGLRGAAYLDVPGLQAGAGGGGREGDVEILSGTVVDARPGEWLEYTVEAAQAGVWDLSLALSGQAGAVRVEIFRAGEAAPYLSVEAQAAESAGFAPTAIADLALEAGTQTLRVTFLSGVHAFEDLTLTSGAAEAGSTDTPGPGTLEEPETGTPGESGTGEPASEPPVVRTGDPVGQAGTLTVTQADAGQWHSVRFAYALDDPSVVMGPLSFNGDQAATLRVRHVTSEGFEFQLDEWDHLDGGHVAERVSWLAVERGRHVLEDGTVVEAGDLRADHEAAGASFSEAFQSAPVVFAQIASFNGPSAAMTRLSDVKAGGFGVRVQESEASDGWHAEEDMDWIAFGPGGGGRIETGLVGGVDDAGARIDFADRAAAPHFFAALQSFDGPDPAVARLSALDGTGAWIFAEEEASGDAETDHVPETAGWLALSDDLLWS